MQTRYDCPPPAAAPPPPTHPSAPLISLLSFLLLFLASPHAPFAHSLYFLSPQMLPIFYRFSLSCLTSCIVNHLLVSHTLFFFLTPPKKPQHCQPYHHFPSHTDLIYQILWFFSRHHLAAFIDSFHYWVLVRVKYLKSVSVLTTPTVSWRCLLGFVATETNAGKKWPLSKDVLFFFLVTGSSAETGLRFQLLFILNVCT